MESKCRYPGVISWDGLPEEVASEGMLFLLRDQTQSLLGP
jgi:hypothetical protein